MTDKNFFHLSPVQLEKGTILDPQRWRNGYYDPRAYNFPVVLNQSGKWKYLLKEEIFERIRKQEFPNKPSRFNCCFLCENIDDIVKFKTKIKSNEHFIYKVSVVQDKSDNIIMHKADFTVFDIEPSLCQIPNTYTLQGDVFIPNNDLIACSFQSVLTFWENCARSYWRSETFERSLNLEYPEILIENQVEILEKIDV